MGHADCAKPSGKPGDGVPSKTRCSKTRVVASEGYDLRTVESEDSFQVKVVERYAPRASKPSPDDMESSSKFESRKEAPDAESHGEPLRRMVKAPSAEGSEEERT